MQKYNIYAGLGGSFGGATYRGTGDFKSFAAIYTVGKSLSYQDALLLGIKEAIKFMKTHKKE